MVTLRKRTVVVLAGVGCALASLQEPAASARPFASTQVAAHSPVPNTSQMAMATMAPPAARQANGAAPGPRASAETTAAAVLPVDAEGPVSAALGRDDARYRVTEGGTSATATNPRHDLRLTYATSGLTVDTAHGPVSLALAAMRRGDKETRLPAASPRVRDNRVEYRRGALTEWYVNGPVGLEQGFTFDTRPEGHGELALDLALDSALRPSVQDNVLTLTTASGEPVLRYRGLTVVDANGATLPATLTLADATLRIAVNDDRARYPVVIDPIIEAGKLTASGGTADDALGTSIAIDGDVVVAGAPQAFGSAHGVAYVFVRPSSGWGSMTQVATLTASDGANSDWFGLSVAISGDTIVVGARQAKVGANATQGAAYVFVKPAGGWTTATETAKLTVATGGANDLFGSAVATSGDTIVVGAMVVSKAYVFTMPPSGWTSTSAPDAELSGSDVAALDLFGASLAMTTDTIVVGSPGFNGAESAGEVYVFSKPSGGWQTATETAKLKASDPAEGHLLGASVAISGGTVAAGAGAGGFFSTSNFAGAAYVFVKGAAGWADATETAKLTAPDGADGDQFGLTIATDGATVAVGAPGRTVDTILSAGKVYLFTRSGLEWTSAIQSLSLVPSDRELVAVPTGVVVGSYVERLGTSFGRAVALDGSVLVAGSPGEGFDLFGHHAGRGSAYVYDTAATQRSVSLGSVFAGLQVAGQVTVTGTGCQPGTYATPTMRSWVPGSSCVVTVPPQTIHLPAPPPPLPPPSPIDAAFSAWSDASTSNPRTFTAPATSATYTATLAPVVKLLTAVSPDGAGTVSGAGSYVGGAQVPISATAAAGWQFASWSVSGGTVASSTDAATTLTMGNNGTVATANFIAKTAIAVDSVSAVYGATVQLSATVTPVHEYVAGSLAFSVTGGGSLTADSVAGGGTITHSFVVTQAGGNFAIKAAFTPSGDTATASTGTGLLQVSKRQAKITPSDASVLVKVTGATASTVTLAGTVADTSGLPVGASDITKANGRVLLTPTGGGSPIFCSSTTNSSGAVAVTCTNVPVGSYTATWLIDSLYYQGDNATSTLVVSNTVTQTIASSPSGLSFSVSGTGCSAGTYATPRDVEWVPGSSCVVTFASPQAAVSAGTRYAFSAWADGGVTANPRTITAPTATTTYTANFKTQYQLTTAVSPAGAGTASGVGFYDANASASIGAAAASGYAFAKWIGSGIASTTSASTTVLMDAPKSVTASFAVLTNTTVSAASGQYSDAVTLGAAISGASGSLVVGSVQFKVDGVNAGAAVPVNGTGSYSTSYTIAGTAGLHTISAAFTPSNSASVTSSGTGTLTVKKEDATVTPSSANAQAIKVNVPGGTAGPVTLAGLVAQASDGSLGDVSKATVTVQLVPLVGSGTVTCTVTNTAGGLNVGCGSLPVNVYSVVWTIGGNYFAGPQATSLLAVYDPSLGFVTGGGTVLNGSVVGEFALNVKYLKNGQIQGGLAYVEHRPSGDVVVKTNSLTSLSIVGNSAVLLAKATANGAGGYTIQAAVTDNGEPGGGQDLFGLAVSNVLTFAQTPIAGGNIQVPQGAK